MLVCGSYILMLTTMHSSIVANRAILVTISFLTAGIFVLFIIVCCAVAIDNTKMRQLHAGQKYFGHLND